MSIYEIFFNSYNISKAFIGVISSGSISFIFAIIGLILSLLIIFCLYLNKGNSLIIWSFEDDSFSSFSGSTFVFVEPGEYTYFCAPHPWMRGTVTVVEPAA